MYCALIFAHSYQTCNSQVKPGLRYPIACPCFQNVHSNANIRTPHLHMYTHSHTPHTVSYRHMQHRKKTHQILPCYVHLTYARLLQSARQAQMWLAGRPRPIQDFEYLGQAALPKWPIECCVINYCTQAMIYPQGAYIPAYMCSYIPHS